MSLHFTQEGTPLSAQSHIASPRPVASRTGSLPMHTTPSRDISSALAAAAAASSFPGSSAPASSSASHASSFSPSVSSPKSGGTRQALLSSRRDLASGGAPTSTRVSSVTYRHPSISLPSTRENGSASVQDALEQSLQLLAKLTEQLRSAPANAPVPAATLTRDLGSITQLLTAARAASAGADSSRRGTTTYSALDFQRSLAQDLKRHARATVQKEDLQVIDWIQHAYSSKHREMESDDDDDEDEEGGAAGKRKKAGAGLGSIVEHARVRPRESPTAHDFRATILCMRFLKRVRSSIARRALRDSPWTSITATHLTDPVQRLLSDVGSWDFDLFALERLTGPHLLQVLAHHIFVVRLHALQSFHVEPANFANFFAAVEKGYNPVPYHSATHGADVLQNVFYFLTRDSLRAKVTDLDVFAGCIAAAIHDYNHPGTNNAFQIAVGSPIALRYNDRAVLECTEEGTEILTCDPSRPIVRVESLSEADVSAGLFLQGASAPVPLLSVRHNVVSAIKFEITDDEGRTYAVTPNHRVTLVWRRQVRFGHFRIEDSPGPYPRWQVAVWVKTATPYHAVGERVLINLRYWPANKPLPDVEHVHNEVTSRAEALQRAAQAKEATEEALQQTADGAEWRVSLHSDPRVEGGSFRVQCVRRKGASHVHPSLPEGQSVFTWSSDLLSATRAVHRGDKQSAREALEAIADEVSLWGGDVLELDAEQLWARMETEFRADAVPGRSGADCVYAAVCIDAVEAIPAGEAHVRRVLFEGTHTAQLLALVSFVWERREHYARLLAENPALVAQADNAEENEAEMLRALGARGPISEAMANAAFARLSEQTVKIELQVERFPYFMVSVFDGRYVYHSIGGTRPASQRGVDVVYMLHNPLIAHDWSTDINYGPMDTDEDGNRAKTALCLQAAWDSLGIDVNVMRILFLELNPVCTPTAGLRSEDGTWTDVCRLSMLCALDIGTSCIAAFGAANNFRWRHTAQTLEHVTEFVEAAAHVSFMYKERQVRVFLGAHPSARSRQNRASCVRAVAGAHNYLTGIPMAVDMDNQYLSNEPGVRSVPIRSVVRHVRAAAEHAEETAVSSSSRGAASAEQQHGTAFAEAASSTAGDQKDEEEAEEEAEGELPSPEEGVDYEESGEMLKPAVRGPAYRCIVPDCDIYQKNQRTQVVEHIFKRHEDWLLSRQRQARVDDEDEDEAQQQDDETQQAAQQAQDEQDKARQAGEYDKLLTASIESRRKDWHKRGAKRPEVSDNGQTPFRFISVEVGGDHRFVLANGTVTHNSFHVSESFLLMRRPHHDLLSGLSPAQRAEARATIISMVLATDMSAHFRNLAELQASLEAHDNNDKEWTTSALKDRVQVLEATLHCADLGNPTKPLPIYLEWTERVMREFYEQGDAERARGLPISAMCDRTKPSVERSQVGFIDFIVRPVFEAYSQLNDEITDTCLFEIGKNREHFSNLIAAMPSPSPPPVAVPAAAATASATPAAAAK